MILQNVTLRRYLSIWFAVALALRPPLRAEDTPPPERFETNQYLRELPQETFEQEAPPEEDVTTVEEEEETEEPPIHYQTNQFLRELPPETFDIEATETTDVVPKNILYMSIIMAGMFVLGQFVASQGPGKIQPNCMKQNSLHDRK